MKLTYKFLATFTILALLLGGLPAQPAQAAATHTVTNTNDSGAGSLRQAVLDVDPGGTIYFASSLAGQTITLSDLIVINKDLTIDGSSLSSHVKVSGGGSKKVFVIGSVTVNIDHLDIIDGYYAVSSGGGITTNGNLTVTNSNFSGNHANEGAAIHIMSPGNLTVDNCTFTGNSGNYGSAIGNGSWATISNSTFSGNSAVSKGGSIWHWGYTMTISNSTFSDNSSYLGGAIHNVSIMTVTDSTFSGNTADTGGDGGAIYNGAYTDDIGILTVKNSTFTGNSSEYDGGGIYNGTTATISNSTFSGNHGTYSGGIFNSINGTMTVVNTTVTGNSTDYEGGGLYNWGALTLKNSILANSASGYDCYNHSGDTLAASTNNLIETNGPSGHMCDTPTLTIDPKLSALANNGGPTKTHALLPGSPAMDAGNNTTCADVNTVNNLDQRGITRPIDGDGDSTATCDIGSFEFQGLSGTTTLRSQGKYDGWILESSETSGKGGTKNNTSKTLFVGDDAYNRQYRSILSFNTSGIPDSAIITSVKLKIKKAGLVGTNPLKTHGGLYTDIRKNKFGTLKKLQLSDFQAKASKNKVGKFKKASSGWYKAVLGSGAYPYVKLNGTTQFRLRFAKDDNNDFGADFMKFYSGNAGTSSRPQLIVEYYLP